MQAASVIHGCCHAELRYLTEPEVSGHWTANIWEREVLVALQYPGPNLYLCPNKASKALVASGSGTNGTSG
jgi:hypothetical protein